MIFKAFHDYFPEIAVEETRCFTVLSDPELPGDTYYLYETYCTDPDCDCRRVIFAVSGEKNEKTLASISFGWEKKSFYAKWMRDAKEKNLKELQGPSLSEMAPQTKLAPAILDILKTEILTDKDYVDRLKRHYAMFKDRIKGSNSGRTIAPEPAREPARSEKIGRNEPCPCGSGKKYKKCCLKKKS